MLKWDLQIPAWPLIAGNVTETNFVRQVLLPDADAALSLDQLRDDVVHALAKREQKKDKNWNITLASLQTSASAPFIDVVDLVVSSGLVGKSSMVFLGSTDMELKPDFLNRVRMNSIQGRQIFCPIPFSSFHPKVVRWISRTVKKPTGSSGHFDQGNRNHASFFVSDFENAKEKFFRSGTGNLDSISICKFFRWVGLALAQ